jgi:hypothetical protein
MWINYNPLNLILFHTKSSNKQASKHWQVKVQTSNQASKEKKVQASKERVSASTKRQYQAK